MIIWAMDSLKLAVDSQLRIVQNAVHEHGAKTELLQWNLGKLMREIVLNAAEMEILFRQDPGTQRNGGYQSLLVRLQRNTNRVTGTITLTDTDLERIPRYAFDYGNGGWEGRLTGIFARELGTRLGR